jgi:SSS family solute:Na+ symporter
MNLEFLDYLIISLFISSLLAVRFFIKSGSENNCDSYFLAGRKLTLPFFTASLVSTWYGNILGVGEIAFSYGLVNWLSQGLFWYVIYLFFAFFLATKINSSKLLSIPDQIEKHYGRKSALVAALVNTLLQTPASYILSLGLIFGMIFGIDTQLATVICACIPLFYTMKGAYRALVYADFIQFCFMFLGLACLLPFAIFKYGAWDFLAAQVPADHLHITGNWDWQQLLAWFLIACWTFVSPSFYQVTYSAQDSKTAKNGILLAVVFWVIFDLMVTFSGIYACAVMPNADPKLSLALFAGQTLPVVFRGVFFAGLIATVLSTLDSLVFSSAMSLSYDFFGRAFNLSADKIIKLNRVFLVVVVIIGLLIALCFTSLFKIIYLRGSLAIASLLIPLLSIFFLEKKPHPDKIFISIIVSFLVTLTWFLAQDQGLVDFQKIEPVFLGLLSSALVNFWPTKAIQASPKQLP